MKPNLGPIGQTAAKKFKVPEGFPEVPQHAKWLGHLSGSWEDVGYQYGENVGNIISMVLDYFIERAVETGDKRGKRLDLNHLVDDCRLYEKQMYALDPQMIDFTKGIAQGASKFLAKSRYADKISDYEKVLLINCYPSIALIHPDENAHMRAQSFLGTDQEAYHDCSGIAVLPEATEDRKTYVAHNIQQGYGVGLFSVTYAATPPRGRTYWTIATAGMVTFNALFNDRGISVLHMGGSRTRDPDDFGVPNRYALIDMIVNSSTMSEAIERITVGSNEYRRRSGRKTMLRDGGKNYLLAEPGRACVVETTSRHYAVRKPGDLKETGFIVGTNHQFCQESYNEENELEEFPLTQYKSIEDEPIPSPGTISRFWTLYYEAKYNYGMINVLKMQEFLRAHHWYDRNGNRIDFVRQGDRYVPPHYAHDHSTVCGHSGGYPEKYNNEMPASKVFISEDRKVLWTLGRPCTWEGPWDSLTINGGG